MYAKVICVELAQSKQASDPPLLGKNIPKDHDGIFSPVLPTSIPEPPIDINLTLFPSGNCAMFSVFCDNELPYYTQAPFFPQKYYRFPTDRTSPSHLFSWLFRHLFSPFAMRSDA